jgi:hypothetical protein
MFGSGSAALNAQLRRSAKPSRTAASRQYKHCHGKLS